MKPRIFKDQSGRWLNKWWCAGCGIAVWDMRPELAYLRWTKALAPYGLSP